MARFKLTRYDEIDVRHAREALATSKALPMNDASEMARMIGRLEVAVEGLLSILDGPANPQPGIEGGEV